MKRSTFETDPQPHDRTKTEAKLDLPDVIKRFCTNQSMVCCYRTENTKCHYEKKCYYQKTVL